MSIVTGEQNIENLRLFTIRMALAMEIRTGMKRSNAGRPTLAIVNDVLGTNHRNKRVAYAALNEHIVSNGGNSRAL